MKKLLSERFQQLAGIKPLYQLDEKQDFSDSFDDAYIEKMLKDDGTRHVSYVSGKGVKMTDEDWAQHKGKYTINNGRIGYVKDDGSYKLNMDYFSFCTDSAIYHFLLSISGKILDGEA